MVIPNLPDTVCTIVNRSSDQETCLAWNGVRAWASKHNYTPPRNKPQEVNYVWIADHTKLDIFVKTTQNPDTTDTNAGIFNRHFELDEIRYYLHFCRMVLTG